MPEKYGISQRGGVLVAAVLIGFVVLGTYLMQTQHRLKAVEIALTKAKDETVRAQAEAAKLTKATDDLRTELKAVSAKHKVLKRRAAKANAAIVELNEKLDTAQLNLQEKQSQLQAMEARLSDALDTAQLNLQEKQSQLQAMEARLSDAKHALDKLSAEAVKSENEITKLRQGIASCEEFSHEWENPGTPVSISAIAALGREAAAAKDCISKGNISAACRHWQGLLAEIEKIGPPVSESRSEIEQLMRQNRCEAEGYSSSDYQRADP